MDKNTPSYLLPKGAQETRGGGEAGKEYNITRTSPSVLRRHDISDEELGVLSDMRRDYLWEGMWIALGVFLGSAPHAIPALSSGYSTGEVPVGDLVQVVILFVSFGIFVVLCWVTRKKGKDAGELVKEIRERTARRVHGPETS